MTLSSSAVTTGIILAGATLSSVFFLQLCGTIFQCGCQPLWGAMDAQCNIHHPGMRHCPFCTIGAAGQMLLWGSIVGAQAAVCLMTRTWSWPVRLAATAATFPIAFSVLAVLLGWRAGYWN